MRWGIVLVVLTLLAAGCSEDHGTSGGGLSARVLEQVGDGLNGVSAGPNHLYALDGSEVYSIDPATGAPFDADNSDFRLGAIHTRRAVAADGAIWFTSNELKPPARRMSPGGADDELLLPDEMDGNGVAVSDDIGWVLAPFERKAVPFTKEGVAGAPVEVPCELLVDDPVGGPGAVWGYCEEGIAYIDTAAGKASLIDIGRPVDMAVTSSALWALGDDTLHAVDPRTGKVMQTVDAPPGAGRIVGFGNDLWVLGGGNITLHDGSDARQLAGPVPLPQVTDQVETTVADAAAFNGKLFLTLNFHSVGMVVVERTS